MTEGDKRPGVGGGGDGGAKIVGVRGFRSMDGGGRLGAEETTTGDVFPDATALLKGCWVVSCAAAELPAASLTLLLTVGDVPVNGKVSPPKTAPETDKKGEPVSAETAVDSAALKTRAATATPGT